MRKLIQLACVSIITVAPAIAGAGTYDLHIGGMCSTEFVGGKGGGYLGAWPNETSINVRIDQNDSMATATVQLAGVFNTYCTGNNYCYLYTYSNGGAVVSRALSIYDTAWNIGYAVNSASNEGGSEIGGTGSAGELFGGCYLAGHIGPSDHRNGWNHHDTNGIVLGHIGGNGWLFPWGQHALLPGHDDGAVAHHSAGGYLTSGSFTSLCSTGRWTNHQTWWSCEYGSLDHTELKMKGICNDGGASGCP